MCHTKSPKCCKLKMPVPLNYYNNSYVGKFAITFFFHCWLARVKAHAQALVSHDVQVAHGHSKNEGVLDSD